MEAEGAASLSEVGDGSPLSGAAASDETDTVIGVGYGMEAGDIGNVILKTWFNVVCILCRPSKH